MICAKLLKKKKHEALFFTIFVVARQNYFVAYNIAMVKKYRAKVLEKYQYFTRSFKIYSFFPFGNRRNWHRLDK